MKREETKTIFQKRKVPTNLMKIGIGHQTTYNFTLTFKKDNSLLKALVTCEDESSRENLSLDSVVVSPWEEMVRAMDLLSDCVDRESGSTTLKTAWVHKIFIFKKLNRY